MYDTMSLFHLTSELSERWLFSDWLLLVNIYSQLQVVDISAH